MTLHSICNRVDINARKEKHLNSNRHGHGDEHEKECPRSRRTHPDWVIVVHQGIAGLVDEKIQVTSVEPLQDEGQRRDTRCQRRTSKAERVDRRAIDVETALLVQNIK